MNMEYISCKNTLCIDIEDFKVDKVLGAFSNPEISNSRGTLIVCDGDRVVGIITRGDVERCISTGELQINTEYLRAYEGQTDFCSINNIVGDKTVYFLPIIDGQENYVGGLKLGSDLEIVKNQIISPLMELKDVYKNCFLKYVEDNNIKRIILHGTDFIIINICRDVLESLFNNLLEVYIHSYNTTDEYTIYEHTGKYDAKRYDIWEDKEQTIEIQTDCFMYKESIYSIWKLLDLVSNYGIKKGISSDTKKKEFYALKNKDELEKAYGVNIKFFKIPKVLRNQKGSISRETFFFSKDFFEESKKIKIIFNKGIFSYHTGNLEFFNIYDGQRLVPGYKSFGKVVHIIGPCIVGGAFVDDNNTIGAYLQKRFLDSNYPYGVKLYHGVSARGNYLKWLNHIKVGKGDIIIFLDDTYESYDYDLTYGMEKLVDEGEFFYDKLPIHCNSKGQELISKEIFTYLYDNGLLKLDDNDRQKRKMIFEESELKLESFYQNHQEIIDSYKEYLSDNALKRDGNVGSIVMNCDPFTLGHRYLVEYACSKVDYLYLFVLEEEGRFFSFEERLEMARRAVSDLKNVIVLRGGKVIISSLTFPEYSIKGEDNNLTAHCSMDIELFATVIAPKLHIKHRFLGEEPTDKVTRQYNEMLNILLPEYGIDVHIIKRKEVKTRIISASVVRDLITNGNISGIKEFVPESTYCFINERYTKK